MNFHLSCSDRSIVADAASPSGQDPLSSSGGSCCHVTSIEHRVIASKGKHGRERKDNRASEVDVPKVDIPEPRAPVARMI
jgi:hypothetical protein